jgi:hypothetical protein
MNTLNGIAFTAEPQATAGMAARIRSAAANSLRGPASAFGIGGKRAIRRQGTGRWRGSAEE